MNEIERLTGSYASIGRRFLAMILDGLIVAIPTFILNKALPVLGGILVAFLYAPVLESSEVRATIGKQLMGIQVTGLHGERISFRTAVIRYLMKFVSSIILLIGYIMAFFTQRKQALHDLVAETVVVYGRSERPIVDAWVAQVKALFRSAGGPGASGTSLDKYAELERLQALREKGVLTEEEFQAQKARILGSV